MMRIVTTGLVLLLLSGCGGGGGGSNHRYYVLNPTAETAAVVEAGAVSVQVISLRLPQYLDRPQIVTRRSGSRLKLAEFHQWGGNLQKDMVRVLANNLSTLLGTPNIAIAPAHPGRRIDVTVEVEVMQFERDADGYVTLSAQWRLSGGRGGTDIETRFTRLRGSAGCGEEAYECTVEEMGKVFAELSREIALAIGRRLAGGEVAVP